MLGLGTARGCGEQLVWTTKLLTAEKRSKGILMTLPELVRTRADVVPRDIISGIGAADRPFLAACLALFDDSQLTSTLSRQYSALVGEVENLTGIALEAIRMDVTNRVEEWNKSTLSDAELRLLLWMSLREAMALPAKLSTTHTGAAQLPDDLSAAIVHLLAPPPVGALGKALEEATNQIREFLGMVAPTAAPKGCTLNDVVVPVFEELLNSARMQPGFDDKSVDEAVAAMKRMGNEEQEKIRARLGVDELNRDAVRKMMATSGGLAVFSASVGMAGFSAYILAAQASAFIPFVSGPGLVSLVAVLSNPIAMVGGAAISVWYFASSAGKRTQAAVASRVVAMLALHGMQAGRRGVDAFVECMGSAESLPRGFPSLGADARRAYTDEWGCLLTLPRPGAPVLPEALMRIMDKPLFGGAPTSGGERQNAAALGTVTLGEFLYCLAAVDPAAVNAADFSYVAAIDGRLSFAELASAIVAKGSGSALGEESRLKGYVAEHLVAAELTASGHVVEFPGGANEPGWDLIVDGVKMQVKFRETNEGLLDALAKHPEYPVIANTELMGKIPAEHADKVFFIDGLSNELVTEVTHTSVVAGADALDGVSPSYAFALSAFRGAKGVYDGKLSAAQAAEQILLDGMVRTGLFVTGGIVGSGAGFLLFGPAGAWVLGAGMPIVAQAATTATVTEVSKWFELPKYREWASDQHAAIDVLQRTMHDTIETKTRMLKQKLTEFHSTQASAYFRWRIRDQLRFARESQERLKRASRTVFRAPEARTRATLLLANASAIYPACYQKELQAVADSLKRRPTLTDEAEGLWDWLKNRLG
jgi:hypothetical protein